MPGRVWTTRSSSVERVVTASPLLLLLIRAYCALVAENGMHRAALATLGASAFVYVTAETIPIGLLPQIADGLDVTEANVGLLLTSYAVVAGVTTIPLTAITMRIPRHLLIAATVAIFVVSQVVAAVAPTFLILVLARLICAVAHGVFWSAIAPVAARLAPPDQAGRATAMVFLGNSLAIVLGVPLGTALGQWLGWRVAIGALAVAGAICVATLLVVLPKMPALPQDLAARAGARLKASIAIIRVRPGRLGLPDHGGAGDRALRGVHLHRAAGPARRRPGRGRP